ncbi:MAG: hypothetical protein HWD59_09440 [Coxiellaceae bacterium]|nr:MAG: hypothetical protein HWD59_09440 [Coxiellaceae bacterium]
MDIILIAFQNQHDHPVGVMGICPFLKTRSSYETFPLFSANKLKAIPVVEKIGGEVIFISEAEFQQKFACEYTESIWATEDLASYYSDIQQASKKPKKLTKDEKN